jgi:LDH2 family malate/lactate/ureidoglycolate dehydrogenase
MSHSKDNRQVRIPGSNDRNVAEHCQKFGISPIEERKLQKLLGKRAPLHEIQANVSHGPPKFR